MEIKKSTRCNKVLYRRIASTQQSINNYLVAEAELEALMNGVEIDLNTVKFSEEELDIRCGDNLEVTLSVTCI